eukprot:CAMPEP_0194348698 /NCGR_PEP_ID=MMETSP0171-20130528/106671_1 /TAXON_ID=218684 /ORGANISM="Corethron pennatum, Strain L29A3" /LENGTH=499 /DNA_ID=CAMNT_0039116059 /DNA_START=299 /DNA_END=1798 /DNA_ORIENTATION=-
MDLLEVAASALNKVSELETRVAELEDRCRETVPSLSPSKTTTPTDSPSKAISTAPSLSLSTAPSLSIPTAPPLSISTAPSLSISTAPSLSISTVPSTSEICFDDGGIVEAVDLFFDNPDAAEKQYGEIGLWLTCRVTNLAGVNVSELDPQLFGSKISFNQDLNGWDVSSPDAAEKQYGVIGLWQTCRVTNLAGVNVSDFSFQLFGNEQDFNEDLNGWDVSSVTSLFSTFAYNLNFNGRISDWDVSSVETFQLSFADARSFNQPIGGWDVSSSTNFKTCFYKTVAFNQCLDWLINVGADTEDMFKLSKGKLCGVPSVAPSVPVPVPSVAPSLTSEICFDDDSILEAIELFFDNPDAAEKQYGVIGLWQTCRVTNLAGVNVSDFSFQLFGNEQDFNEDLNGWDVSSVTSLLSTFTKTFKFNERISDWDVSSVETFQASFALTESFNQQIAGWDVSSSTNFRMTFIEAIAFNTCLDWSIKEGVDTEDMFARSKGELVEMCPQ